MPKIEKFPTEILENSGYDFEVEEDGLYLIEIIAGAKSWWQNLKKLRAFFDDDDLAIKIDGMEFPKLGGKRGLFDSEAAWNGNNLKGLKKTGIFILNIEKGLHKIEFVADKKPIVHNIAINKVDGAQIEYIPKENKQAEDGNRRQWITIAMSDLPLQNLEISAKAEKRDKDRDDIKLIIDGEIQKNPDSEYFKNWYWCGSLDDEQVSGALEAPDTEQDIEKGGWKIFHKEVNLQKGLHYIELWADRMPTLNKLLLHLKKPEEKTGDEKEKMEDKEKKEIQKYNQFHGTNGKEDYDRFDKEMIGAVDYWNNFFAGQEYPPEELLDYNLVKAISYRESRIGYQKGGEIDIMQVGNEGDPALHTLNNDGWVDPLTDKVAREYEIQNGVDEVLDYGGEAQVTTTQVSIYWGIRWLYHKAQGFTNDKKRYWRSWKDAVLNYGPGKAEYADYIWMIYKEGIAVEENVRNILWIKKENGAIFLKLLFIIGFSLLIGGFGYYLGVRKYLGESTARKEVSAQEIYKMVDKIFLEDLEDYKKETMQYGDFFEDTLRKCRELGCIKQAVVYDKYKIIIENMRDNEHFLAAIGSLGAENNFFLRDIDNDGKNEIAFLMYDPLNRDNIILSAIDKNIDGNFELTEKNIKWGHSGSIEIFDLTGDLKPEIVSYISFGKGGECLFVYQYDYPEFKEIFTVREFLYPEYTFSDADNDQKMEIKVIGEGADRDIIEEVYEYDPNQNNFVLMSDESQGEGKYEDE